LSLFLLFMLYILRLWSFRLKVIFILNYRGLIHQLFYFLLLLSLLLFQFFQLLIFCRWTSSHSFSSKFLHKLQMIFFLFYFLCYFIFFLFQLFITHFKLIKSLLSLLVNLSNPKFILNKFFSIEIIVIMRWSIFIIKLVSSPNFSILSFI